jgi:hypothetical protein
MENAANNTNELNVRSSDITTASDSSCKILVTCSSLRDTVTVDALLCGVIDTECHALYYTHNQGGCKDK